ncbi:MAG TPA: hypothetical protein VHI78_12110 [Bacteroidales bacterium]|jgi:hypothetical protein|nr:hypothetical protein [Bacteroidales bacterium]
MKTLKAVITADIVNSSLLGNRALNSLLKSLEKQFNAKGLKFGFYRGDSFHALCEVSEALKLTCIVRTLAVKTSEKHGEKGCDIRISIGIGRINEPVKELGIAKGEAFVLSGREMDKLEKNGPRLAIRCPDALADTGLSSIALFTDFIITKMTVKQAEVVHELLHGATQVEVAKRLKKTQSTVNKHAGSAHWNELLRLLEIYDKMTNLLIKS